MHGKFLVLTENGKAVAVLTGSTNWMENDLFGHLNRTHVVEDAVVADAYLALWGALAEDPGALPDELPANSVSATLPPRSA